MSYKFQTLIYLDTYLGSRSTPITPLGPDLELKMLREHPLTQDMLQIPNPIYDVQMPTEEELSSLQKIKRSQIVLTRLIGSGAFGEVYEGRATGVIDSDPNKLTLKVAVKTLRKGVTEQSKADFLKEAALMANFKHENILRIIGICLDNDPNFIIMELMEAGDLLTFLRSV